MRAAPTVELLQTRAMTRSISLQLLAVACAATACHSPGPDAARPAQVSAAAEVRARERAWLDAYEQRDPVAMADILAEGFVITFPDGGRQTRAEVVASMERGRAAGKPGPRFTTRGTIALERDGVVTLVGEVIMTSPDAPAGDVSTYTDTWVREGATWRVLASHLSRARAPAR
jgi:predicted CxxxxCH...CXXCH cytochrome family protein